MDNYLLNYTQVMMLMHRIEKMKNANLYLDNDQIVSSFISYVTDRTYGRGIYIKEKNNEYEVPRVMIDYLVKLTGADIFDEGGYKTISNNT